MKKQLLVFCFAIMAVTSLMAQNVIDKEVEKAVKGLAGVVLSPLKITIKEITLDGTNDMTDRFSGVLYDMVRFHAVENSNNLFIVVDETKTIAQRGPNKETKEPSINTISGKYSIIGKNVRVILELKVDDKIRKTTKFEIPVSEIENMGISLIPDNFKTQKEAEKQDKNIAVITGTDKPAKNQNAQTIQIQAWFDSQLGSRVYMHREPLDITVTADKDCYFKILHIDVNNKMKMIYPNSNDKNNYLRANTPRVVFENTNYMIYGPYGAETILICASTEQFQNIERDYISPWIPATADSVRSAIKSGRGDLEPRPITLTQTGEGEARYTFTILKPNDDHRFGRPENLTEFFKNMRSEAEKEGAVLKDHNENSGSGYYLIKDKRVSYRIPSDAPDMIEFAYYNLNSISGGNNVRGQTRGASHSFDIEKPRNITQAIQMVRSGIEGKGGTFNGDEQQGNFKASGIEGQYRVTELVKVTITDKPLLIPNSLIEKEVRNYFGGK